MGVPMLTRAKVISIAGIVLVPIAAYYVPYLSPFASVLVAAALAIALVWAKPGSPMVELGLSPPRSVGHTLALGVAVGVALVVINRLLLTPLIEHLTGSRRDLSSLDYLRSNGRALIALLPAVWVSAGLCEEIVYRGYLITQAAKLLGSSRLALPAGIVFAAIAFALAHWHQGLTGMLVTGTVAMLLSLLFLQQRGSLWVNVVAHIAADTVSLAAICVSWDRSIDAVGRSLFFGK
jgi:membrane protease YdiL (CAAX protease family)